MTPTKSPKNYRYPGPKPFERSDAGIFFGRSQDIANVCHLINLEHLVVLYGKSGLGKSSLMNAGVIPVFEGNRKESRLQIEIGDYRCIRVRYFPHDAAKQSNTYLIDSLMELLPPTPKSCNAFLDSIQEEDHLKLWLHLRKTQVKEPNVTNLLVFDQFEELSTYPEAQIAYFKEELYTALNTQLPNQLLEAFQENYKNLKDEHSMHLESPLPLKVVFIIRYDRLSVIHQLKDQLPDVLKNLYELRSLNEEQAREAIIKPSQKSQEEGNFITKPFSFDNTLIEEMLEVFSNQHEKKEIESFQVQIICRKAEEQIEQNPNINTITQQDLGDLHKIIKAYFQDILQKLSDADRKKVQILIEENLIISNSRQSLSLDVITEKHKVPQNLLDRLVDEFFLLRREPNNLGTISYELTHDSLIHPILGIYRKRKEAQDRATLRAEELKKLKEERRKKRYYRLLITIGTLSCLLIIAISLYIQVKMSERELKKSEKIARINRIKAENSNDLLTLSRDSLANKNAQLQKALGELEAVQQEKDTIIAQNNININPSTKWTIVIAADKTLKDIQFEEKRLDKINEYPDTTFLMKINSYFLCVGVYPDKDATKTNLELIRKTIQKEAWLLKAGIKLLPQEGGYYTRKL